MPGTEASVQGKLCKEKSSDVTKALAIISGYSKMVRKAERSAGAMENADNCVCFWKLLPEKGKGLTKWVKKDDIYIDYPVIS